MGICETNDTGKNIIERRRWSQPFHAPIRSTIQINNSMSFSQADIMSFKNNKSSKPTLLYKYRGSYGKKDGHTTLISENLYNSFSDIRKKNSREITNVEETLNESSSQVFEIIADGKMDKDKVKQSTDKTTIDNYIEYIDNKEEEFKDTKVDIYNIYNNKNKKNINK